MKRGLMILLTGILCIPLLVASAPAAETSPELKEALTLDRQGFIGESIAAWQKFLATDPPENLYVYGGVKLSIAHAKIGRFLQAMKAAQSLAEKYPDNYEAQFNLGNMLSAVQQYGKAARVFKEVTGMRPQEGLGHVGLGLTYFGDGQTDKAVKTLRKARKLFKEQKNISWYQNIRIMIGQMKSFAPYPPDFSNLWLTNNIKTVRETYEKGVFRRYEDELNL